MGECWGFKITGFRLNEHFRDNRYGASAKNLGRPRAPRFLAQGANFDSSAPMARGASLGKSLSIGLGMIIHELEVVF